MMKMQKTRGCPERIRSSLYYFIVSKKSLPRNAHAKRKACIRAERNALLAVLAEDMVHSDKEVIAFGMNVEHPAHACCEAVDSKVYAAVEPAQRSPVGADASFCPCVGSVDARAAQCSECYFAVNRQVIFSTDVYGCTYSGCTSALVAVVSEVYKVCNLVAIAVELVVDG